MRAKKPTKRQRAKVRLQTTGYRSGYEERVAGDLTKRGIEFTYEANCLAYNLPIRGAKCNKCDAPAVYRTAHYSPDFHFRNGSYVETKGKFTSTNRTRLVAFRASRPDVVLRLLFQTDNWLTKKHKLRYSGWATRNGIEWAVGEIIPSEWVS